MNIRFFQKLLAVSLALLILLLSACSPARPIEGSDEELVPVGTVGEFEVLYEELRFATLSNKQLMLERYGEEYFSTSNAAAELEAQIYDNITYNYAILTMCREVGIEADDPTLLEAVQQTLEKTVNELGGRGKYIDYLEENYMTDHFYRFNLCVNIMQNELFYVYTDDLGLIESDDGEIYDIVKEKFIRTQHIYISKSNGKPYEENRTRIEDAYTKLEGGADFMQTALEFGEDSELTESGFYIINGYMSPKYEETAFALECDEVSDIIEDEKGFYIVKRLEQDPLYVMINLDMLTQRYQSYTFIQMINDTQATLDFVPNDYLKSLNLLEIE